MTPALPPLPPKWKKDTLTICIYFGEKSAKRATCPYSSAGNALGARLSSSLPGPLGKSKCQSSPVEPRRIDGGHALPLHLESHRAKSQPSVSETGGGKGIIGEIFFFCFCFCFFSSSQPRRAVEKKQTSTSPCARLHTGACLTMFSCFCFCFCFCFFFFFPLPPFAVPAEFRKWRTLYSVLPLCRLGSVARRLRQQGPTLQRLGRVWLR